ncbi:2-hydroxyacid dehydrogenase [Paenibacillus sinopodophylli]|uniref:2-hydroxyacid dehydrogenase n=1 Tax=Paenibacillus sinopodophylli TaxID=1837342 RepID=UPI00110CE0B8|nr:D-glycerate dehydrogenase [Paenibacillus sinopodophylli]
MKPYVFIDRSVPTEVEAFLAEHCTVDKWEESSPIPRRTLLTKVAQAEGLLTAGAQVDTELIANAPKLRAVSSISVGYNHFDLEAMKRHSIIGTHTPHVLDDTVADLAFALILGTARRVAELDRYVKEGKWKSGMGNKWFGQDVHHAKLGIIGMGRIGEAVARRGRFGFDMEVSYFNRSRKPEAEANLGVHYSALNELLAESDFVVMLAPLTLETTKLIGREQFKLMKPNAIFINISRGQTVDEAALIEALQAGTIAAAGLDVFEQEPIPDDHPFLNMNNVLTLPHIGSATESTRTNMAMLAARNLVNALTGQSPTHTVAELQ